MNRNYLFAFIALFTILACVLPSQAAQPVPAANPGAIETAVAGTSQAAVQQTIAAQSVATESVTTGTPTGMTGTAIEQQDGGRTRYSDYDAWFEITFPVGWLALRANSDEFNEAFTKKTTANSMLRDQMEVDKAEYNAKFDRLVSYILRPDIKKNVIFGFSDLSWDSSDSYPLDSMSIGKLVRDLEASGIPGFRADTVQVYDNRAVPMAEIGGHWMRGDGKGGTVPFYTTVIFFKPKTDSLARINFTYLEDYHVKISADIVSIIESIKVIEP